MLNIETAVVDLAYAVREAVRPHMGRKSGRALAGRAATGDDTFAIDEVAEGTIERFIDERELPVAYYTEDRGLISSGSPKYTLIIDPIDGTRPAMAGLEGCVVSIALAPYSQDIRMRDVSFGCILELKSERLITASRGGSVVIREDGVESAAHPTANTSLERLAWTFELTGRPAGLTCGILAPLVDASSMRGGIFVMNSIAFSLTRLVTGQLDAAVDIGGRVLGAFPDRRDEFIRAGRGVVMGIHPYDIAAASVIVEAAGCPMTDAWGKSLDDILLMDSSEDNILTCIAASNTELHQVLLREVDRLFSLPG